MNQIRRLTTILIASGALNIALLAVFFYWMVKDTTPTPYFELKPANKQEQQLPLAVDHSNSDVIRYLRILPMEQLIARLNHTQQIENGYTLRDLALASLVDFHQFDLGRALMNPSSPIQKRTIIYGKRRNGSTAELTVYPGLKEKQFEAIIHFATTERWPLTSKGLFTRLHKKTSESQAASLADAFFMTPEFLSVEMLLGRSQIHVDKKEVLDMLLQGDFSMLSSFVEQQRVSQDLSDARRQRFLIGYIQRKSKAAASLMLKTDREVAARKLDDNHVILILRLLDEKSADGEAFALSLLTSPRSDAVWKCAAARLYSYEGETMPEKYQHHAALSRFVSKETVITLQDPSLEIPVLKPVTNPQKVSSPNREVVVKAVQPSTKKAVIEKPKVKDKSLVKPKVIAKVELPPARPPSHELKVHPNRRERLYVVQEGDSLWKIARRFNVDVEEIKTNNRLQSDFLKPGRPLLIP